MTTKLNVLQVIPKLGYGGAETGCYDIAHFLSENDCGSFLATSGGELIKFIKKDKVRLIRLPVHSKNPILILFNTSSLSGLLSRSKSRRPLPSPIDPPVTGKGIIEHNR